MSDKTSQNDGKSADVMPDLQEFGENIARVIETGQVIWQKIMENAAAKPPADPDPLHAAPVMNELVTAICANPERLAEQTLQFWQAQNAIWQHATLKFSGNTKAAEAVDIPPLPAGGKRFADSDWSENAVFEYIKQAYLLTSDWVQDMVSHAQMPEKDRKRAAFYTRNFLEALNPANVPFLNPEVLKTTQAEKGENLVRGLQMMLEDIERGKGQLLVRQTDMDAFQVGRDMALTKGAVIWQNTILQLIQYAPATKEVHAKPLLVVPPWINKYYILDLNPKKSLIKWLVEQGYTVFVISWVNPDATQRDETWGSYMDAVSEAINVALVETGQSRLNLASYCIGGTLAATLLARMGRRGDKRVSSATFFTALTDFEDGGELQLMVDEHILAALDNQMADGYLPAQTMAGAFNMLRANDLVWSYVVNNYLLGKQPFPFDLLYWNADSTAMPAKVHHYYLKNFYCENRFADGTLEVDGLTLSIQDIALPVYHVATKEDHIAPAPSVYRGAREMTRAKVRFVLSGSGHIAGVVNPPAAGKYQYWSGPDVTPDSLDDWLQEATETAGSWWPDWDKWLKRRSGKRVAARKPGAHHGVIEPAPGSYVKKRFDEA